jgi:transposase
MSYKWAARFKTKRSPKIRSDRRQKILDLRNNGKSYPEIARMVGCSIHGAWEVVKRGAQ